jgi:transposase
MLEHAEPPGYRTTEQRSRPILGPFAGVIDEILAIDADPSTPKKQRHTARRIFDRLRDEHGYVGSEATVRRYVAQHRRVSAEVFIPLSQPPGEAQFDFGEATVEIDGMRVKAALAVMTLPYPDAFFVSAYPASAPRPSRPDTSPRFRSSAACRQRPRMTTPRSRCQDHRSERAHPHP